MGVLSCRDLLGVVGLCVCPASARRGGQIWTRWFRRSGRRWVQVELSVSIEDRWLTSRPQWTTIVRGVI
jgi:hypothetical protein